MSEIFIANNNLRECITQPVELSVVIPVRNSRATLNDLMTRLFQVMANLNRSYEVILVNDCSEDGSQELLEQIQAEHLSVTRVFRLGKRRGQHEATFIGIAKARGEIMITLDDDLQKIPEDIPSLLSKLEVQDLEFVYGVYSEHRSSAFVRCDRIVRATIQSMLRIPEFGSSYRVFRASVAKDILALGHRWMVIDILLIWRRKKLGFHPVQHFPRETGRSNYSPLTYATLTIRLFLTYFYIRSRLIHVLKQPVHSFVRRIAA